MIKDKILILALMITIIIFGQFVISLIQSIRYIEGVYDCSDMTIECADFFNSIGLKVRYVHGWFYDNTKDCGKSFHVWLIVDFGLFTLPFESTCLMFISPTLFNDYQDIKITNNPIINIYDIWGNDIMSK